LKVVFVSACYSAKTGQAFIEAGVPHVVCSRTDEIRDTAAVEFSRNFYRALACQISLKDSFYMAREAVRVSSDIINADLEANKFLLLPEKRTDDPYHDVKVFYQEAVPPYSGGPSFNKDQTNRVPRLPELFVGRELAIFDILESLNDADVIQLEGEDGCGRSTVTVGVCRYMLQRPKSFSNDFFGWFPRRTDVPSIQDRVYDDLDVIIRSVTQNKDLDDDKRWERLVSAMSGLRVTIVLDFRKFDDFLNYEGLGILVRDLINICSKAKILVIPSNGNTTTQHSFFNVCTKRLARVVIPPLDFESTALLFAWITPYVSQRSQNRHLINPRVFADDLLDIEDDQDREYVYQQLGGGNPSQIIEIASTISESKFLSIVS
jgi:hypothetical protein